MPKGNTRRERALIVACVLVALMPLLACALLAVWNGKQLAQRQNDARAMRILHSTERVLDHAVQRLHGLNWTASSACEDDVIESLVYGVYNSIYIREMGVFDPDLALICTNFGRLYVKVYQDIRHALPRTGLFYNVVKTVVMKERSVIVNLRFEHGGGINALIDPAVFVDMVDAAGASEARALELRFIGGDVIHGFGDAQPGGERFAPRSEASLQRYPVAIRLVGRDAEVWGAIRAVLPNFLLAGCALSLLAGWSLRMVWNRLNAPEQALRQALARREFVPYFQPIVNLESGECEGAEALMRWRHPDAGLIPPDSFIPIAERTGLIKPMTRLLIERICAQLGSLLRNHDIYIAVNLSRSHLEDLDIVEDLLRACRRFEVAPAMFVFEITERGLPDDMARAQITIDALRALGCRVAIDDFGTGHNGLAMLQKLPADTLKIDRSFVEAIGSGTPMATVIDSVIELASRLGLSMVAEGVETQPQADYLRGRGVAYAQGFHFAQPMEPADFVLFLERTLPWLRGPHAEAVAHPPVPDTEPA